MGRKAWDAHELAKDAGFRPVAGQPAQDGQHLPESGPGVICKTCGGHQVIPIPIWGLMAESEHDTGILEVPVALVCLDCGAQSLYQARWRPDPEEEGDQDGD